jgi:undecaprenyl-phosphate 4-deoxy-4-formamido-L-arabinose transferase
MILSVVIPSYFSPPNLKDLCVNIDEICKLNNIEHEIIIVDDSDDEKNYRFLKSLQLPHVKVYRLMKNFGQHNATMYGISKTTGDYIITMDDDYQHDPAYIPFLLKKLREENVDIVYGVFDRKEHSVYRNLGSHIINFFIKKALKINFNLSSFRCFTKEIKECLLEHLRHDIVIDAVFQWYTQKISFIEIKHNKRTAGRSGYNLSKLLKLFKYYLFNFSSFPLLFIKYIGYIMAFISMFWGAKIFLLKLIFHENMPEGYASQVLIQIFFNGIILISLGILGEYINVIYSKINKKPMAKERLDKN